MWTKFIFWEIRVHLLEYDRTTFRLYTYVYISNFLYLHFGKYDIWIIHMYTYDEGGIPNLKTCNAYTMMCSVDVKSWHWLSVRRFSPGTMVSSGTFNWLVKIKPLYSKKKLRKKNSKYRCKCQSHLCKWPIGDRMTTYTLIQLTVDEIHGNNMESCFNHVRSMWLEFIQV